MWKWASGEDDDNKKPRIRENKAAHNEVKVVNTATKNMNRGSDKYCNYTPNETD